MRNIGYFATTEETQSLSDIWWLFLKLISITLLVFTIVYWQTLVEIVSIWWKSRTFNHGFIVVPISLYFIWKKKKVLLQQVPTPVRTGWVPLFGLVILWVVANLADVQLIQQFAVVSILPVLVFVLLGWEIFKTILFPLGFLMFAIPFGEFMVPILQDVTAEFTVRALRLTGIPVYIEGRFISIPSGNFEVAEACSGVRYLIASIALGTLYAYVTYFSIWRRSVFILLSVLVPIAANSIRAYGIVMLAHLSDYELATGFDHLIYGWIFFGMVMVMLFWMGSYFREDQPNETAIKINPSIMNNPPYSKKSYIVIAVITSILLLSGPLAAQWLNSPVEGAKLIKLPVSEKNWIGPRNTNEQWNARFEGATDILSGEYKFGKEIIQLYLAYYALQKQGSEIVNSENYFFDKTNWRRAKEYVFDYQFNNQSQFQVKAFLLNSDTEQKLLWHWYEVSGVSTNDPFTAKIAQVRAKLLRESQASAVIIVLSDIVVDKEKSKKSIKNFIDQMYPEIKKSLYKNSIDSIYGMN